MQTMTNLEENVHQESWNHFIQLSAVNCGEDKMIYLPFQGVRQKKVGNGKASSELTDA